MLEIAALSVSYGRHRAFENVSMLLNAGEIVTILGANGAGKSTLRDPVKRPARVQKQPRHDVPPTLRTAAAAGSEAIDRPRYRHAGHHRGCEASIGA